MREIGGNKRYFKYAECKDGDVLINDGRFIRDFQGKYGIQWEFMDDDGVVVVLNSAGQLNYKMDAYVSPGDQVKIIYGGTVLLEKGPMAGKEAHNFTVLDMGNETKDTPEESTSNGAAETEGDFDL